MFLLVRATLRWMDTLRSALMPGLTNIVDTIHGHIGVTFRLGRIERETSEDVSKKVSCHAYVSWFDISPYLNTNTNTYIIDRADTGFMRTF